MNVPKAPHRAGPSSFLTGSVPALFEVIAQSARTTRMPQLTQGLALDLPDSLAGHAELTPDLFEGTRVAVNQTESQLDDLALTL